jgi:TRAP-type C4-dicarboxylate transport system substrate-binding protein
MRIARRTLLASSISVVCAPAIVRIARADNPQVTLKLHHAFSSVSGVHDKFLAPWARKIEGESGGRIRIDIFPSMQLGGAPSALFEQMREGSADLVWTAPSLTAGQFPKIETFELPFLASRRALVSSKALTDFAAVNLQDEFREIYPICFSCSDRAVIHANRPVRTMEDLKTLKLHVQTRFAAEAMRVLGAQPVMMPSEQLPMAITEHVIDACLDPWHLVPPFRLNDVLRLHTEFADVSPNVTTHVLAMNRAGYDRLPRDLKIVIDNNSGQAAAAMAGAMWDNQATAIVNMAVERGDLIVTLLPDAVARWRKAVEPVLDIWRKELKERKIDGGKLINAAHASLAKYANEPEPSASQTPSPSQQVTSQPPQSAATGGQKPNVAPSGTPASASAASPATPAPQPPPGRITSPAPTMPTSPPAAAASPSSASAAPPVKPVAPAASAPAPASASAPSSAQMSAPAATASPAVAPPPPASPTTPAPSVATAPAAPSPVPKPVPKALDIRL